MLAYTPLDEKSLALLLNYLHDFLKYVCPILLLQQQIVQCRMSWSRVNLSFVQKASQGLLEQPPPPPALSSPITLIWVGRVWREELPLIVQGVSLWGS